MTSRRRPRLYGTAVAAAALVSGCAFANQTVLLEHPRASYSGPRAPAVAIRLARLTDARPDPTRIGIVRNGYGMDTASVVSPVDIADVVSKALRDELASAGFQVQAVPAAPATDACPAATVCITGRLQRLLSDPDVGVIKTDLNATVEVDVLATVDGASVTRGFAASATMPYGWSASDNKEVLEHALDDVLAQIVAAIVELARRASPGAPDASPWS